MKTKPGQGVARHGQNLQPQEDDQQVRGREHDHQARQGEEKQGIVFPDVQAREGDVLQADENDEGHGQRQQKAEEEAEVVEAETPLEIRQSPVPAAGQSIERHPQERHGQVALVGFIFGLEERLEDKEEQSPGGEDGQGKEGGPATHPRLPLEAPGPGGETGAWNG